VPDTRHQRSRHAARLGETPRTNQKTAASEGEGRRIGKHLVRAGTQEHPTHKPLISRTTLAEVPLAGLSLGRPQRLGREGHPAAGQEFARGTARHQADRLGHRPHPGIHMRLLRRKLAGLAGDRRELGLQVAGDVDHQRPLAASRIMHVLFGCSALRSVSPSPSESRGSGPVSTPVAVNGGRTPRAKLIL